MRKVMNGRLWCSKRVADYLGISQAKAHSLMVNQQIVSHFLPGEKTPITIKEAVQAYIEETFYNRLKIKSKLK